MPVSQTISEFTSKFTNYGESPTTLEKEIRDDVVRIVQTMQGTRPFARYVGAGLDAYENETIRAEELLIYKVNIATNLGLYNRRVTPDRRVIVSQNTIFIEVGKNGEIVISIYYLLESQLNTQNPNLQSVLVTL